MKKFLIIWITSISFFLIGISSVNAATYSGYKHFTDNAIICASGYDYCSEDINLFNINDGNYGYVYFSFVLEPQVIINNVSVSNEWGSFYTCNIGSQTIYSDNTSGYNVFSAVCPMYITPQGLKKVRFEYNDSYLQQQGFTITMGDYWSFTTDTSSIDYTSLLNSINGNLTTFSSTNHTDLNRILTYQNNIYYQLVDIYTSIGGISNKLDSINNKLDKQQQDNDEWKNTDISDSDKQAPDTTDFNNYQSAENNLFGKMNNADLNNLSISVDADSNLWIWDVITRIYNSNPLIFNFVISILSIGIIKMALGR